jgi:monofunctional biosynthetic peptidoglycan transglycosylase
MRKLAVGRILTRSLAALILATLALLLPLRWLPPLTTTFMLITRISRPADAGPMSYRWVNRRAISRQAALAVIAGEDQKFFEHFGFDFESIRDAIGEGDDEGPGRGASTITQQVAKNLLLWPGHSWVRKAIEAYLTVWIELLWPKERILEIYLNVAQFGPSVFGVEAASRQYFGKPAATLTRTEASLLAAVLPNPVRFRVQRPSAYIRGRQAWIFYQSEYLDSRRLADFR